MLFKIFKKEITNPGALFAGHYIEVKAFYAWHFNRLPCVSFVGETDITKAYSFITERYQYQIESVYQHSWHDHNENEMFFNNSIFVFHDHRMIELVNDYCHVLFAPTQYAWAGEVVKELLRFRKIPEENTGRVVGFARQFTDN
jgi:hypothetical protein